MRRRSQSTRGDEREIEATLLCQNLSVQGGEGNGEGGGGEWQMTTTNHTPTQEEMLETREKQMKTRVKLPFVIPRLGSRIVVLCIYAASTFPHHRNNTGRSLPTARNISKASQARIGLGIAQYSK